MTSSINDSGPPAIPPQVRSIAYFVMLAASGIGSTAIGIAAVIAPGVAGTVAGVVGAVLSGLGLISGGLGVAYRPTVGLFGR